MPTDFHHDDQHAHDHDGGLVGDRALLQRRTLLRVFGGGAVVAALAGCAERIARAGGPSSTLTSLAAMTDSTATATPTAGTSGSTLATTCSTIPEEPAGPFPGDGSNGPNALADDGVVRRNITASFGSSTTVAAGVPLTVDLVLTDTTNDCAPLAGAAVYLWHCDRDGRYSMYSEGATEENYLRGVQEADDDGRLTFDSIFPAAYSGRWPHIHFEVYADLDRAITSGEPLVTSQIALPAATCREVFATDGYEASVGNLAETSLEDDNVFSDDGGASQMPTVTGDVESGFVIGLPVGV